MRRGSVVPLNVILAPPDSTQWTDSVMEMRTKVGSTKRMELVRTSRFSQEFQLSPSRVQKSDGAPTTITMERDGKNPKKRSETR